MKNTTYELQRDKDINLCLLEGLSSVTPPHFHRNLEILYVTEGTMLSTVGEESFVTGTDEIVFVHNYYVHSFYPKGEYKKHIAIIGADFGADVDKIFSTSTLPPHLNDTAFNREAILPILNKLISPSLSPLIEKGYTNVLLGLLLEHYKTVPIKTPVNVESIITVLEYIDEHYREPLSLDTVAAAFGYNKYYFSRFFNRHIGESLTNYVNLVRINNFINLSKQYKNPQISKLAAECGFESMPTFYRSFKRIYGLTPKSYFSKK